jgi:hypothetical protein
LLPGVEPENEHLWKQGYFNVSRTTTIECQNHKIQAQSQHMLFRSAHSMFWTHYKKQFGNLNKQFGLNVFGSSVLLGHA